jgi:adenylosuccinate lyase
MLEEAVILKAKKQEYLEKKRQDLVGKSKTIKKQKQDEFITAERIVKDARRKRMSSKKSARNVLHSRRYTSHTKSNQTACCL